MFRRSDIAIAAAEIEQGVAVPHFNMFDLSNEDRMIASRLRRMQPAFQVSERSMQNRRAMRSAAKARARCLWMLMHFCRPRIIFRDRLLIATEHIDPKALSRLEVRMSPRPVIHAH